MRHAGNTGRKNDAKNRHLGTIAQLCWAVSSQRRHIVVAGFPNPLPDTLHLLLVGLFVYACVWLCVRLLAWLRVPVLVALLVVFARRSTSVHWFRAHTDCACVNYIVLV